MAKSLFPFRGEKNHFFFKYLTSSRKSIIRTILTFLGKVRRKFIMICTSCCVSPIKPNSQELYIKCSKPYTFRNYEFSQFYICKAYTLCLPNSILSKSHKKIAKQNSLNFNYLLELWYLVDHFPHFFHHKIWSTGATHKLSLNLCIILLHATWMVNWE